MNQARSSELTAVQQTILSCVRANPGQFSRSSLAKLLVGSRSSRIGELARHPDFGRLGKYGRKTITTDIDILTDQGFLVLDNENHLVTTQTEP